MALTIFLADSNNLGVDRPVHMPDLMDLVVTPHRTWANRVLASQLRPQSIPQCCAFHQMSPDHRWRYAGICDDFGRRFDAGLRTCFVAQAIHFLEQSCPAQN
jgi:hypothetical protein